MIDHKKNNTIVISGGGSGGHLFPALAIGDGLHNKGYNIKYIGSKYGIESKILKKMNNKYYRYTKDIIL
jgi:UDP-N-acetylglucosamine--N-acetylmuramyl-(pentapeptide) pyrophosphoryl-undecaprenol N-acetylglucosamine transferase